MNDSEKLASYGLGTLFTEWELNVVVQEKDKDNRKSTGLSIPCSRLSLALDLIPGYGVIMFSFPPLVEFNGLQSKAMRVPTNAKVKQLTKQVCEKYQIKNPDRFVLATNFVANHKVHALHRSQEEIKDFILQDTAGLICL